MQKLRISITKVLCTIAHMRKKYITYVSKCKYIQMCVRNASALHASLFVYCRALIIQKLCAKTPLLSAALPTQAMHTHTYVCIHVHIRKAYVRANCKL